MTNAMNAARSYSALGEHTRSNRDLEYAVILDVTRDLKKANADNPKRFPLFAAALHRNERLWTEIGMQVADNNNRLAGDVRARLFFIAEYVALHTSKALSGQVDAAALIEINVSVLRGLKAGAS